MPTLAETAWPLIEPALRRLDADVKQMESQVRSDANFAREMGRDVIEARNRLTPLIAEYQRLRALVGFSPAVGLGVDPITVVFVSVVVAALIASLWAGVRTYQTYMEGVKAKAQQSIAQIVAASPPGTFPTEFFSPTGAIGEIPWGLLVGVGAVLFTVYLFNR